jgi:hypothetical protein
MNGVPDKGFVISKGVPFFVSNKQIIFYTNTITPLVGLLHMSRTQGLVEPIVFNAREKSNRPVTLGICVREMRSNRSRAIAVTATKRLTSKVIGVLDVLSNIHNHFGSRQRLIHESSEHLTVVVHVVDVGSSHKGSTLVDRKSPAVL